MNETLKNNKVNTRIVWQAEKRKMFKRTSKING
jgi:hypothetical protein